MTTNNMSDIFGFSSGDGTFPTKDLEKITQQLVVQQIAYIQTLPSKQLLDLIVEQISRDEMDDMIFEEKSIDTFDDLHNYLQQVQKDLYFITTGGVFALMDKERFDSFPAEYVNFHKKVLDKNDEGDYESLISKALLP